VTARLFAHPTDVSGPTSALHQQQSGPLTEIYLGPADRCAYLQIRDLADLDALIGCLVSARAIHGEAQARWEARSLEPLPDLPQREPGRALDELVAEKRAEILGLGLPGWDDLEPVLATPPSDVPRPVPAHTSSGPGSSSADDQAQHDAETLLARWGAVPAEVAALGADPIDVTPLESEQPQFIPGEPAAQD
jgi:hypothetical protein